MIACSRRIRFLSAGLRFDSIEVIAWFWIGCTLATLVVSQENFYSQSRYGKRHDSEPAILLGSRYGRSSITPEKESKSSLKVFDVAPRMDRFFLGSRYGKRTPMQILSASSLKHFEAVCNYLNHMHRMERIERISEDTDFDFEDSSNNNNDSSSSNEKEIAKNDIRRFQYEQRGYDT